MDRQQRLLKAKNAPTVARAHEEARRLALVVAPGVRTELGQYFTPQEIAQFMASLYVPLTTHIQLLDPCAGTGILSCALAEHLINNYSAVKRISLTAYEIDSALISSLQNVYAELRGNAKRQGVDLDYRIENDDFLTPRNDSQRCFDIAIMNPPYFKLRNGDTRGKVLPDCQFGVPNIYASFLIAGADLLRNGGSLVSITPRSFTSGVYFRRFRHLFFSLMSPERIHLFESRDTAFRSDGVLQENMIMHCVRTSSSRRPVILSSSQSLADIQDAPALIYKRSQLLDMSSDTCLLLLPVTEAQKQIINEMQSYDHSLHTLGLDIITGRVVPFRCRQHLRSRRTRNSVPLLWMQHIQRGCVVWPAKTLDKPQYIDMEASKSSLLHTNQTCILVRRFSAKEDRWRVVAAAVNPDMFGYPVIGVENHLNVIVSRDGELSNRHARAVEEYLNSEGVDAYFRSTSGNTQIGSADLKQLPAPSWDGLLSNIS